MSPRREKRGRGERRPETKRDTFAAGGGGSPRAPKGGSSSHPRPSDPASARSSDRSRREAPDRSRGQAADGRSPRRADSAPASTDASGLRSLSAEIVVALCLALAAGFYGWVASGAKPWEVLYPEASGRGLLQGLPTTILAALAGAAALVALLRFAGSRAEPWKGRLALAAGPLYLAAAAAPARGPALLLAPLLALAALVGLGRRVVRADSLVLVVHAGLFGTALCLYERWGYYGASWVTFTDSVRALVKVLF